MIVLWGWIAALVMGAIHLAIPPRVVTNDVDAKAKRFIKELITENTRLAGAVRYGTPQPVHRSIDIATSLRLMGLDPTKSHLDDKRFTQ